MKKAFFGPDFELILFFKMQGNLCGILRTWKNGFFISERITGGLYIDQDRSTHVSFFIDWKQSNSISLSAFSGIIFPTGRGEKLAMEWVTTSQHSSSQDKELTRYAVVLPNLKDLVLNGSMDGDSKHPYPKIFQSPRHVN